MVAHNNCTTTGSTDPAFGVRDLDLSLPLRHLGDFDLDQRGCSDGASSSSGCMRKIRMLRPTKITDVGMCLMSAAGKITDVGMRLIFAHTEK